MCARSALMTGTRLPGNAARTTLGRTKTRVVNLALGVSA